MSFRTIAQVRGRPVSRIGRRGDTQDQMHHRPLAALPTESETTHELRDRFCHSYLIVVPIALCSTQVARKSFSCRCSQTLFWGIRRMKSFFCALLFTTVFTLAGCDDKVSTAPAADGAAAEEPSAGTTVPAQPAVALHLDDKSKAILLALPKDRNIIITSGDADAEQDFAFEMYTFFKSNGYDLDEPDRQLLTSIDEPVKINMNSDDLTKPIQIFVGKQGF